MAEEEADGIPAEFLAQDFDVQRFVQRTQAEGNIEPTLARLQSADELLRVTLGQRVTERFPELVAMVDGAKALEAKIVPTDQHIAEITKDMRRARASCLALHETFRRHVSHYAQVSACAAVLRKVQRVLYLCKRMRETNGVRGFIQGGGCSSATATASATATGSATATVSVSATAAATSAADTSAAASTPTRWLPDSELPKVALALHEAEKLIPSLTGIVVIETELPLITSLGVAVRSQAESMLWMAVREKHLARVGAALQIYFNFECMPAMARHAARLVGDALQSQICAALQPVALVLAGGRTAAQDAAHDALEPIAAACERLAAAVYEAATQIHALHRVLAKKRDPLSHELFAELLNRDAEEEEALERGVPTQGQNPRGGSLQGETPQQEAPQGANASTHPSAGGGGEGELGVRGGVGVTGGGRHLKQRGH